MFRFDFKQLDGDGRFVVDAHAGEAGRPTGSKAASVAVLFADGATFLELVRTGDLDAGTVASIEEAARSAMSQPGTPVCCMRIDLSETQLVHLNLQPVMTLYR